MSIKKSISLILIIFISFVVCNEEKVKQPNILFIAVDDLRTELGCYGNTQIKRPEIDKLASEGLRLTNFNVEAQCTPSRAALMTGRHAIRSGNGSVPWLTGLYGLTQWEVTMAEMLADVGYATGMFGKWHLGQTEGRFPTDQGFDEWWGISESSDEASYSAHRLYPNEWPVPKIHEARRGEPQRGVAAFDLATRPLMDEGITERTVEFIGRNAAVSTNSLS